jgi:transcriptional regulator with XRE-family HTH domain
MSKQLYERLGEVKQELNIDYNTWAEQLNINYNSFGVMRSNMKRGSKVRFSTLKKITPESYIPILFVDTEQNKRVNLGNKKILWGKNFNQEEYISKVYSTNRILKKAISKSELAKLSNISILTYMNLENKGSIPSINTLEVIAENLDLRVEYLVKKTVRKNHKKEGELPSVKTMIESINYLLLKNSVILDQSKAKELRKEIRVVKEINSTQFVMDDINELLRTNYLDLDLRSAKKFYNQLESIENSIGKVKAKIYLAKKRKKGKL